MQGTQDQHESSDHLDDAVQHHYLRPASGGPAMRCSMQPPRHMQPPCIGSVAPLPKWTAHQPSIAEQRGHNAQQQRLRIHQASKDACYAAMGGALHVAHCWVCRIPTPCVYACSVSMVVLVSSRYKAAMRKCDRHRQGFVQCTRRLARRRMR